MVELEYVSFQFSLALFSLVYLVHCFFQVYFLGLRWNDKGLNYFMIYFYVWL